MATLDHKMFSDESDAIVDNIAKLLRGKPPDLVGFVLAELLAIYLSGYFDKESRQEVMRLHVVTAMALAECYESDDARH